MKVNLIKSVHEFEAFGFVYRVTTADGKTTAESTMSRDDKRSPRWSNQTSFTAVKNGAELAWAEAWKFETPHEFKNLADAVRIITGESVKLV